MGLYVLYRVLYFFAFCFYFPYLLCKTILQKKSVRALFRHLFPERIVLPEKNVPTIWAHAVSVGEVVAITPILNELISQKKGLQIVLSTVTETGFATAKKMVPNAICVRFPFDFTFSIRKVLGDVVPSLILLSEGDVWPVFLHEMKQKGACIALVNGKISDNTFKRFQKFHAFGTWLYGHIDIFCVQSDVMKQRLEKLGVNPENISVTGNTKTDKSPRVLNDEEKKNLQEKTGLSGSENVIVVGSTHHPEEDKIIESLLPLLEKDPFLKVVIVPRHPERACQVVASLQRRCVYKVSLLSSIVYGTRILVVDELGILTSLYQIATVAIVGGSFVEKIGGHNIFEPAVLGVPTIVGPYMHAQRALFESALKNMAVIQVGYPDLSVVVGSLLRDEEVRKELVKKVKQWAESIRGASEKTVNILLQLDVKKTC